MMHVIYSSSEVNQKFSFYKAQESESFNHKFSQQHILPFLMNQQRCLHHGNVRKINKLIINKINKNTASSGRQLPLIQDFCVFWQTRKNSCCIISPDENFLYPSSFS